MNAETPNRRERRRERAREIYVFCSYLCVLCGSIPSPRSPFLSFLLYVSAVNHSVLFLPDDLLVEAVELFIGEEVDHDPATTTALLEVDARAKDATEAIFQAIEVGRAWGG